MQLAQQQPDGATLRAHLVAAVQAGAPADPRLTAQVPSAASGVWVAFVDLSEARPNGMSPGAIPPSEMDAWQRLHQMQLTVWEVETLQAMDRAAMAVMAEHQRQQQQQGSRA